MAVIRPGATLRISGDFLRETGTEKATSNASRFFNTRRPSHPRYYSLFITMSNVDPSAGTVKVSVDFPVW